MSDKIKKFLYKIIEKTEDFFEEEMGIEILYTIKPSCCIDTLKINKNIAMIELTGSSSFTMAMSCDDKLLKKLVSIFLEGESYDDNEEDEVFESTAGELVNILVGFSLPETEDEELFITPPIFYNGVKDIYKDEIRKHIGTVIKTSDGELFLSAIY